MMVRNSPPETNTVYPSVGKDPPTVRGVREMLVPSLGLEVPWRRAWKPIPEFLPEEYHGQRSLVGYSPWGHKASDTTEATYYAHLPVPQGTDSPSFQTSLWQK